MVLCGVSTAAEAVHAAPEQRPTYIGADLRDLHAGADTLAVAEQPAWRVEVNDGAVTVVAAGGDPGGDGLSIVRATARAVWDSANDRRLAVHAGDDTARAALQRWSLLSAADRLA
jgi:hypothetical protein